MDRHVDFKVFTWIGKISPYPDESLVSFLFRWAKKNVINSRSELLHDLEVSKAIRIAPDQLAKLAKSLDIPPATVVDIAPTTSPSRAALRRSFTRPVTEAICPDCMKEAAYSRQIWSNALATACPKHGVRLIDRCPVCKCQIKQDRALPNQCDCGMNLLQLEASQATVAEVEFAKLLIGEMPQHSVLPFFLQGGIPAEIDLFMWGLVNQFTLCADGKPHAKAGKVGLPKSTDDAVHRIVPILELLTQWPQRFDARLERMIESAAPSSTGAAARLGRWYFFLFRQYPQDAFHPFRVAAANRIVLSHDGLTNARTHSLTSIATVQKNWYSVKEASAELGVSADNINDGIDRCLIDARVHDESVSYRQRFIGREEIERLRHIQFEHISDTAAMELLQIPKGVFRLVCEAGWIVRSEPNDVPPVVSGYIKHQPLLDLIARLHGFAPASGVERPKGVIKLRNLNLRRTTDLQRLLGLFRAIAVGDIKPVGQDECLSIGELIFSQSEVDKHVASWFVARGLTLQQISELMDTHYDAVKNWVDEGLLLATKEPLEHGSPWVVHLRDFVDFLQTYAPLARQAKECNSTTRGLTSRLTDAGIRPLEPEGGRGTLVKITDLMTLC